MFYRQSNYHDRKRPEKDKSHTAFAERVNNISSNG